MSGKTKTSTKPPRKKTSKSKAGEPPGIEAGIEVASLLENPDNPRYITEKAFDDLKRSIQDFPKMMTIRQIVIESFENPIVMAGNMRLRAIKALGYTTIPNEWVKTLQDFTEDEKNEFLIKDNLGYGKWDFDKLANEWDLNILQDWGLELPEMEPAGEPTAEEDRYRPPKTVTTKIKEGNLIIFRKGELQHRLYCGDSRNEKALDILMGGTKAKMVFTDPPYGVSYESEVQGDVLNDDLRGEDLTTFLSVVFKNGTRVVEEKAAWYIFHASRNQVAFEEAMMTAGLKVKQQLIWSKQLKLGWDHYHWSHEPCFYGHKEGHVPEFFGPRTNTTVFDELKKEGPENLKKDQLVEILNCLLAGGSIWEIDRDSSLNLWHPTQKPILLIAKAINNSTRQGWPILELFGGSGSTMAAGHQLQRPVYAMELKPEFCQVHIDRMRQLDEDIDIQIF